MTPSTRKASDSKLGHDLGLAHSLEARPLQPSLREAAKHVVLPEGIKTTLWPRVQYRLQQIGESFDPWQEGLTKGALGLTADGLFAASIGGVTASIPRQVGKTYWVSRLLIALCIEIPGLRCIWTSHHGRTTTNTFRSVSGAVLTPKIRPHLRADRSHGIRTSNGEQEIRFANGSIIQFGAREAGFGRGMDAIDVIVFDEAQILGTKALEDMVPATNAAKNPYGGLLFFIGTPPRPVDDGEAFRAKRTQALSGGKRNGMYVEIAGDADLPPHSKQQYLAANPAHPHRVPMAAMERMAENLPDTESWKREALGIWDERVELERELPLWDDRMAAGPASAVRPVAFGIDRDAVDGVSIVAAWHMPGNRIHLEEVMATPSMEEAADFLAMVSRIRDTIFIDAYSAAAPMVPLLAARKRKPLRSSAAEFVAACALIDDGIASGDVTHDGEKRLSVQAEAAVRREVKGGGWAWNRGASGAPIHSLVAASLAVLGARRAPVSSSTNTRSTRNPRSTRGRRESA